MDWGSIVIGLAGLLLAAFTTYVSYQQHKDDKKSTYRESLYSKQIEACQNIAELAAEYLQILRQILGSELEAKDLTSQIAEAKELQKQLRNKYSGRVIFVTDRMHRAFNEFIVSSRDALRYVELDFAKDDSENSKIRIQKLRPQIRDSYNELVQSMREIIGTEHFNKEAFSIMEYKG